MIKYLLCLFGVLLITIPINCNSTSTASATPAGEAKISYFAIAEGMLNKKVSGYYVALISWDWFNRYQKKLNEPFEKLKLPPGQPAVKIAPDDVIVELMEVMQNEGEGFYSLKASNMKRFTMEEMNKPDFRTRVLTIDVNDLSYSVAMEDLPPEKQPLFIQIRDIFLKNYQYVESWKSDVIQDWDTIIKKKLREKQNQDK